MDNDDLKRRIRKLKTLEIKIRFGGARPEKAKLVWDEFFRLRDTGAAAAKYGLRELSAMDREQFKNVVDEFFFHVYFRFCRENGMIGGRLYDPDILSELGLPPDADQAAVKKKFRQLALKYHPDTGGDAARFIALMDSYRKLIEKGK